MTYIADIQNDVGALWYSGPRSAANEIVTPGTAWSTTGKSVRLEGKLVTETQIAELQVAMSLEDSQKTSISPRTEFNWADVTRRTSSLPKQNAIQIKRTVEEVKKISMRSCHAETAHQPCPRLCISRAHVGTQ